MVRAQPERSVSGETNVIDHIQITSLVVGMQLSIFETEQAGRSTGKDPAVRGLAKREKRDIGQMKRLVHTFELVAMAPEEAAVCAGPHIPVPVRDDRADELIGKALPGPERLEAATLIVQQSASIRRDPQGPVG